VLCLRPPPPTAMKSRDARTRAALLKSSEDVMSSVIVGTVMSEVMPNSWIIDTIIAPLGIVVDGARQTALPTDKERHGARKPKP
jgi:hypothetical protein